jgi:predicted metal-dependent peptidase
MANLLNDPKNIASDDFEELNEKLKIAQMLISRSPDKKGFPFVYCFTAQKEHVLEEIKIPIFTDENGNEEYFYTAATDGKKYYWSPQLIREMTPRALAIIMAHETYHVVLQHCIPARTGGKLNSIWNIAVDYVVNGMIEHDVRQSWPGMNTNENFRGKEHPLWKEKLGKPLYFDELLDSIKEQTKRKKAERAASKNGKAQKPPKAQKKKTPPSKDDLRFYADYSLYGKSAEEIYDQIIKAMEDLTNEEMQEALEGMGISMDEHMEHGLSKGQLFKEILDAARNAKKLAGTVPGSIEDQILKLQEPKLSAFDIIRNVISKRRDEKGRINDWSRFKRRGLSLGLYQPKKKDDYIRWCAFLDTSGSMSQDDLTYAVSQLKCLDGRSEGIVIPNDAQPYWDKATDIKRVGDLQRTKVVGRGGTVFKQIFDEFPKKMKKPIDVLIILTDGGIFDMPELKRPNVKVVWILTNDMKGFNPPFGEVAPLRTY